MEKTNKELATVLEKIAQEFDGEINPKSRTYCVVDIGEAAESFGMPELKARYEDVNAIIPLRRSKGLAFEVDGSSLNDARQLTSGVVVEEYVAKEAGVESQAYVPHDTMYLC